MSIDPLRQAQEMAQHHAARVAQLEQILYGRSVSTVNEVIDGLIALNGAARNGDPTSRQMLAQLTNLLDQSRTLAAGIVTARELPPNGRSPG